MKAPALAAIVLAVLALAACGGGTSRTGRTVTFDTAGAFPTLTIVGHYSASNCAHAARVVVADARDFYLHSTTLPGPADLYFYDMREGYAHFQADDCTSKQLGDALARGLITRQRTWLQANLPAAFSRIFRAALSA